MPRHGTSNNRKFAYYNQIRSNGIATIYKTFLKQETPFIPRKFREGRMPGESEEHRRRMEKMERFRMSLEIERLEDECSKQQKILDDSEKKIEEIIGQCDDPEQRQIYKELWLLTIKEEEGKSGKIWDKHRQFFENLPNNDQKPRYENYKQKGQQFNRTNNRSDTYSGNFQQRTSRYNFRRRATENFYQVHRQPNRQ